MSDSHIPHALLAPLRDIPDSSNFFSWARRSGVRLLGIPGLRLAGLVLRLVTVASADCVLMVGCGVTGSPGDSVCIRKCGKTQGDKKRSELAKCVIDESTAYRVCSPDGYAGKTWLDWWWR